jgi:hypothetical protein
LEQQQVSVDGVFGPLLLPPNGSKRVGGGILRQLILAQEWQRLVHDLTRGWRMIGLPIRVCRTTCICADPPESCSACWDERRCRSSFSGAGVLNNKNKSKLVLDVVVFVVAAKWHKRRVSYHGHILDLVARLRIKQVGGSFGVNSVYAA